MCKRLRVQALEIAAPSGMLGMHTLLARIWHESGFLRCCERLTAKNTGLTCADIFSIKWMRKRLEGWGSTIELHPQIEKTPHDERNSVQIAGCLPATCTNITPI